MSNNPPEGLLAFFYYLNFDQATKNQVKQENGLEQTMDQFDLPADVQNLFREIEQAGQVRETDKIMLAQLVSAYIIENYDEVYQGIW